MSINSSTATRASWTGLVAVALALFSCSVCDVLRADEKDGLEEPGAVPMGDESPAMHYLNQLIFGGRETDSAAAARADMVHYLRQKVVETDLVCGLTERQKENLLLAGRGDIQRIFDRIDACRRKLLAADDDVTDAFLQQIRQEMEALRDDIRSNPFDRGSLFAKTRAHVLTALQSTRCAKFVAKDRLTGIRLSPNARKTDEIQEVRFPATAWGDDDLARLAGIRTLQNLILDSTQITDEGLVHLAGLSSLAVLDLGDTKIDGSGLVHLRELKNLRSLDLRRTPINSAFLSCLRELTTLKELFLQETPTNDMALAHVANLTGLRELYLRKTQITDAGLAHLRDLIHLRKLDLDGTQISDAGLAHLQGLTGLEVLDLRGTRITDAGLAGLAVLENLRHVYLFDTAVTDAGIANLQEKLANVRLMLE
jgi:hypothetical protein